jgi:hypothetical protein
MKHRVRIYGGWFPPTRKWTSIDKNLSPNTNGREYGKLHRENGPAFEDYQGSRAFFLNGKHYFEEEYWEIINEKID